MRNVNLNTAKRIEDIIECFILTMRNVNTGIDGIFGSATERFILTMRNVNFNTVTNQVSEALVLY